jgi:hypothetical protein
MPTQHSYLNFRGEDRLGTRSFLRSGIIMILIFSFLQIISRAQSNPSVHTSVSAHAILLGQQTELTVELSLPREMGLSGWFNYPDTFNHLEILSRQKIDTVTQLDNILYRQKMVITGFDSGRWVIPSMTVEAGNKKIKTDTLSVFVSPVSLKDSTYHDIKEIISVPEVKTPWWYWVLGAITLAVLIAAALYFFKKRKPAVAVVKEEVIKMSPIEQARQSLKLLKQEQLPGKGELKKYYIQLQDILRVYMQRRYAMSTMQKTTSELLVQLKDIGISEEPLSRTAEVLRIGDAVKFAKYLPESQQQDLSFDVISGSIENLEKLKSQQS